MTILLSYNVKKIANDDDGDATTDKLKYTPKAKQRKTKEKITQTPTHQNRVILHYIPYSWNCCKTHETKS